MKRSKSGRECRESTRLCERLNQGGAKRFENDSKHLVTSGLQHNHTCAALTVLTNRLFQAASEPVYLVLHTRPAVRQHSTSDGNRKLPPPFQQENTYNQRFQLCFLMKEAHSSNPEEVPICTTGEQGNFFSLSPKDSPHT